VAVVIVVIVVVVVVVVVDGANLPPIPSAIARFQDE
jgi:hypothetical protein